MKKVTFSALAAVMLSGAVYADTMTLFSDPKTGQVFTTDGEGRVEMGDFVDAKTVDMADRDIESSFSEYKDAMKKYVNVKSHAKTLDFSGTHYFGLTNNTYGANNAKGNDTSTGFEFRRNYLQAKAYFTDKDYFRVTMDTTDDLESTTGNANMYVKYAYLYLDKILPYTGVEIGVAHRPWIDYEEHNSWNYRSINKVILEDKFSVNPTTGASLAVDTMNSADMGVNFQTKTPYFSSELGLFDGEGYHPATNQKLSTGLSEEWRLTGHLMGNGEKVGKYKLDKDTYANISFAGIMSQNEKYDGSTQADSQTYDKKMYLLHAVYNQPEFLIAAQYDESKYEYATTNQNERKLKTWSVNGEIRPAQDWTVLARYDSVETDWANDTAKNNNETNDGSQIIYGVAYDYNKNIKFIASGKTVNAKQSSSAGALSTDAGATVGDMIDKQSYMLTTEVNW
ncbi:MAG: hypothetical protein ACXWVU_05265 [Sulfuricurvum sp.]